MRCIKKYPRESSSTSDSSSSSDSSSESESEKKEDNTKKVTQPQAKAIKESSSSSSSSSDDSSSDSSENEKMKKDSESESDSDSDSDDSDDSDSDSSSSSSSAPSIRQKGKKKDLRSKSVAEQQPDQRLSPSPPPQLSSAAPFAQSIFASASDETFDQPSQQSSLRESFRTHWLSSIADNFSNDLDKLRTEPQMNEDKLRILINALSDNSTAIKDNEGDLVMEE